MSAPRLSGAGRALALTSAILLGACAATGPDAERASAAAAPVAAAAAPLIQAPATSVGQWVDLGHVQAPWLAGDAPVPVSGPVAPTRVAGQRRDDGRWRGLSSPRRESSVLE